MVLPGYNEEIIMSWMNSNLVHIHVRLTLNEVWKLSCEDLFDVVRVAGEELGDIRQYKQCTRRFSSTHMLLP